MINYFYILSLVVLIFYVIGLYHIQRDIKGRLKNRSVRNIERYLKLINFISYFTYSIFVVYITYILISFRFPHLTNLCILIPITTYIYFYYIKLDIIYIKLSSNPSG